MKAIIEIMKAIIETNSSFWLVETNFLSSRNSIVLFSRASLKNLKFGRTTPPFLRETFILLVETQFLASGSHFLFSFSRYSC